MPRDLNASAVVIPPIPPPAIRILGFLLDIYPPGEDFQAHIGILGTLATGCVRRQMGEPVPQRTDRLRRIVTETAIGRQLVLGHRAQM
jgi:hypothetical protein